MALSKIRREELLELYSDLRVADVRDGMDWMMRHNYGSMAPEIRPLWRTRAVGIARTAHYLPYRGVPKMTPDEYSAWSGWYCNNVCTYPWIAAIEKGDFCVIDQVGERRFDGFQQHDGRCDQGRHWLCLQRWRARYR